MIRSFRDSATQDVFDGRSSKKARRVLPLTLWDVAARKLELIDSVIALDELRIPPRNRLEAPKGGRGGQYEHGPEEVEIVDHHRNKRGSDRGERLCADVG